MNGNQPKASSNGSSSSYLWAMLAILCLVLMVLFHESLIPNRYPFANDSPLGAVKADENAMPDSFTGRWSDLHWLGFETASTAPCISALMQTPISTETFFKIFPPFCLLFLGFCAWVFFRQLGFNKWVCIIGGLATGLNMHFFSTACWGQETWDLSTGAMFLAMAALVTPHIRQFWARACLAGLCVGLGVVEGFDVGAFMSLFVGCFAIIIAWIHEKNPRKKLFKAVVIPTVVVVFALLMACSTLVNLIGTQIKGISGTSQDEQSKAARWDYATIWSLPKLEFFRVFIPGVFGYKLDVFIHDTDRSSCYWGRVGEDTHIQQLMNPNPDVRSQIAKAFGASPDFVSAIASQDPQIRNQAISILISQTNMTRRYSGTGEYAGVLVSVLALFGIANAFRRKNSPFEGRERCFLWFWIIAAIIALFLAFGRFSFLYYFFYQLPYVSTIRNPIKFMHPFHMAWIILAVFGLEALSRHYLSAVSTRTGGLISHIKTWLKGASEFDKKWVKLSFGLVIISVIVTLVFLASRADLERYLEAGGFPKADPGNVLVSTSSQIIGFFYGELLCYIPWLALCFGILICIMSGAWNGKRAKVAWFLLVSLMVVDLARSDWRWVDYYDFNDRYATNPVLEFLKDKPHEHRVVAEIVPMTRKAMTTNANFYSAFYFILQNQIPYLNIQTLDFIQMPRLPEMDKTYIEAFRPSPTNLFSCVRLWQLTNTRYVLGSMNPIPLFRPEYGFEPKLYFQTVPKPGVTVICAPEDFTFEQTKDVGPVAIYELKSALPRAKLYAHWTQATTNEQAVLQQLASPQFDPHQSVFVASDTPLAEKPAALGTDPGTVNITYYKPKHVQLHANANTGAVLLLNDRFAPDWQVWVDGKQQKVLRLNYIMRGVYLTKGDHTVDFKFKPDMKPLLVSAGACALGVLIGLFSFITNRVGKSPEPPVKKSTDAPVGTESTNSSGKEKKK